MREAYELRGSHPGRIEVDRSVRARRADLCIGRKWGGEVCADPEVALSPDRRLSTQSGTLSERIQLHKADIGWNAFKMRANGSIRERKQPFGLVVQFRWACPK